MDKLVTITKQYKDHTVPNPVNDLRYEMLPDNAYSVHAQPIRKLTITIQVLDEQDGSVIETITGKAESGSIRAEAESLIRRTGSLTLVVDDDLFPQTGSLVWFNRYIRVYAGIDDNSLKDHTVNFLLGTFWIGEGTYTIDSEGSRIEISLEDKMMKWDGKKIEYPIRIDVGTPIDVAIKLMMESFGETEFGYFVEAKPGEVVPYTLEFNIGDEMMSVITKLRDMYMDYHCGYNVQGQFELTRVESQREEDLAESKWRFDTDDDTLKSIISFTEPYSFRNIKNRIVVYGATSDVTGITPSAEVKVTNVKSPFNVYSIGEHSDILIESKYVTDDQCAAFARYKVWQLSNFQEIATITSIPLYILDLNDVIELKHPKTGEEYKYIVDAFSYDLTTSSVMSITAHKVYYAELEYGRDKDPIVEAIIRGITNYGWLSLGEDAVQKAFNIVASGNATVSVRFQENIEGGEQMAAVSYATTKSQSLVIDLADFATLDLKSESGTHIQGSGKSLGDYIDRVMGHEAFHLVTNDYFGHNSMIEAPVAWKEGFAEFTHGAKERYLSVFSGLSSSQKKTELVNLAKYLLDVNFSGTSEDYVASYLIAIACYRLAKRKNIWKNLFVNLKNKSDISINFWLKFLPIATTNDEVKALIIDEIENMTSVWTFLNNTSDKDTGSVLGAHFENYYGTTLTADSVFNNANATSESIGFKLQYIR